MTVTALFLPKVALNDVNTCWNVESQSDYIILKVKQF